MTIWIKRLTWKKKLICLILILLVGQAGTRLNKSTLCGLETCFFQIGATVVTPDCRLLECKHKNGRSEMKEINGKIKQCGPEQQCKLGRRNKIKCVCNDSNLMKVGKKCKGMNRL